MTALVLVVLAATVVILIMLGIAVYYLALIAETARWCEKWRRRRWEDGIDVKHEIEKSRKAIECFVVTAQESNYQFAKIRAALERLARAVERLVPKQRIASLRATKITVTREVKQ